MNRPILRISDASLADPLNVLSARLAGRLGPACGNASKSDDFDALLI